MMRAAGEAKGFDMSELRAKACVLMNMSCNSTVTGVLDTTDCELSDLTRIDFWEFQGIAGQTVTIDMTSDELDTFLGTARRTPYGILAFA